MRQNNFNVMTSKPYHFISAPIIGVLIVFGGFAIYKISASALFHHTPAPVSSPSSIPLKSSTVATSKPADWHVYTNTEYGFQLILTDAWKGYRVIETHDQSNSDIHYLYFQIPTKDQNYGDHSGYAAPFSIGVWPKSVWEQLLQSSGGEIGPAGHKIATRENLVFVATPWQDPPTDIWNINFEVPKIISSFMFIQ